MNGTKIPTAGELTPEEWDRILEGYRRLLNVAEAAKAVHSTWNVTLSAKKIGHKMSALQQALNALEAPMPENGVEVKPETEIRNLKRETAPRGQLLQRPQDRRAAPGRPGR